MYGVYSANEKAVQDSEGACSGADDETLIVPRWVVFYGD
jgi:hypothetical protein